MKPFLTTMALAAGLIVTLTAAGEAQAQRFRYIGDSANLSVLAADATGPETARTSTLAVAVAGETGPGGSDTFIATTRIDCKAGTLQLLSVAAYAGDKPLPVENSPTEASPTAPNSPFRMIHDYVCKGVAPDGAPVWIEGPDAARAYARDRARESR